ncbi:MAG: hypothetical protein Q6K17_09005, partial [Gloeomargarita sp. GMQP_bins_5]
MVATAWNTTESQRLFARAQELMPGGVSSRVRGLRSGVPRGSSPPPATGWPTTRLTSDDLPTLGRPTTATTGRR